MVDFSFRLEGFRQCQRDKKSTGCADRTHQEDRPQSVQVGQRSENTRGNGSSKQLSDSHAERFPDDTLAGRAVYVLMSYPDESSGYVKVATYIDKESCVPLKTEFYERGHELRKQFPKLRVTLREGYVPEVLAWLQQQEIDVSLGLIDSKPPPGVSSMAMFKMPLVLLVPKSSKLKSADELWEQDRIKETLISVPRNELITRTFQNGLVELKVDWFSGIEVSSFEMVQTYVANGYGIGVTVDVPKTNYHPQVRPLPLKGFEQVLFGVLWQGGRNPLLEALFKSVQDAVRELMEGEGRSQLLMK